VNTLDDKPLLSRHVYMGNGFITPRRNGYMLLGATYEEEDGPPSEYARLNRDRISVAQFEWLLKHNQSILPALFTCDVLKSWRGWRPTPADKTPILGIVPNRPRIVVATGYIGLGITMAPATAQTIADYCLEGKNSFPLSFSPARFIDR
jgi:glycine/D-amino acid oxidase-like deaminating enzyme